MRSLLLITSALLCLNSCSQLYYNAMEKIGKEKRDILISRVIEGKKDQEAAKEQIKTTLEAFQAVTGFDGGNLEKTYKKLNGEFEAAEKRANDLSSQIKSIDKVASDLFTEWAKEIDSMSNASLKSSSQRMLQQTRANHQKYIARMRLTERKIEPVLKSFRDQVLYLKHNLNAKAIGSLKETSTKMDSDVALLVKDMEASIAEADGFIKTLSADKS